jgi:6-phosphofructokinase 1
VGVPKTIDNDLDAMEVTFGFDAALVIATEAIDRLHTTAESHHSVMLIEVMGRDAGWTALHSRIAGNGKAVPPGRPREVVSTISANRLGELLPKEILVPVLGYVQRGGSPTPFDRIVGTHFGVAATDLVAKQQFGRMVYLKAGKMESVSLDEALEKRKYIDPSSEIVHAARAVGATSGDSA